LVRILGDESPHPVDSDANDRVRERLTSEIQAIGFEPIVSDNFHCGSRSWALICSRVQNVMFWVGEPGPNAIMVASHYDSVPTGPGAADDGSGVAASLEIAYNLKDRDLSRPVLVMITDGEEVGLIGAAYFVEQDPIAKLVSAVVSMEARGNSGPVALIETNTPNGRELAGLTSDIQTPIASSLAADVYAAMPNATDVTEYLKLGLDASNFALGGDAQFYHTPQDNLARLDKRSFFHMGATALGNVEALLDTSGKEPEQ
jgi:Zn-dependent M28 family amino/carboxypeptidase